MNRRDLLLQQMGIQQWQLWRPEVLKGRSQIQVASQVRLLILAEQHLDLRQPLLQDLLRSLELNPEQCVSLSFNQLHHLQLEHEVTCWQLGEAETPPSETSNSVEKNSPKNQRTFQQFFRQVWHSPSWLEFQQNPSAKKQLWQQIQSSHSL